jgi:hypothetical protein
MSPITNEQLAKKLGISELPTETSVNIETSNGNSNNDYLKLLEITLLTPILSLIKMYLVQTNGSKKTTENCMLEFKNNHKNLFFFAFTIDLMFRLIYLSIVILVAVRGLGIDQYLKTLFSR